MPVKIIYHGHSNLEIHSDVHRLQFDPFYDQNPISDVRSDSADPTYILLSHAHFDHTDDAVRIARRTGATVLANFEMSEYYAKRQVKAVGMNIGGGGNFPFGRASMTFAIHTSTFPDGSPGGVPAGWVVEIGGKVIYFAGDTALFGDMALIGKLWSIDLACLPIGDFYTMGPREALMAADMLKARHVLPIHYNTYPPITQDGEAFGKQLAQKGIAPVVLKPGGTFAL